MPIRNLWNDKDCDDIHVVAGHATTELWTTHAVVNDAAGSHWVQEYQAHHADVRFRFIPRFRGTVTGHTHRGFGIRVNMVTGQVLVDAALPTPRPHNFLLELEAAHLPAGAVLRHRFRIHVHEAYDRVWLTPDKLSIRRRNAAGAEDTGCRFSLHAQFTDGVLGDVTDNPEVNWGPAAANPKNVDDSGSLRFAASDGANTDITIRASIRYDPAVLFDEAILHVDPPWSAAPPLVAELVPGSMRMPSPDLAIELPSGAVVPADHVPNVLFIGDGFTDAEAPAYRSFVIDIAHTVRQDPLSFPWSLMRGSMNFWVVHVAAAQYGVSIGGEVTNRDPGGGFVARIMPVPKAPPVPGPAGDIRGVEQLIHEMGLPLPGDAARPNADILADWTAVLGHDPSPRLGPGPTDPSDAIDVWKIMATRGLVDEVDSPLGSRCGALDLDDPLLFGLFGKRGGRARMNSLLRAIVADLPDASGVVARRPIGHLWAERADGTQPPDYDLVCIVAPSGGREQNGDGFFFANMFESGPFHMVDVAPPIQGNRYEVAPQPPADRDAPDGRVGRVLLHELSHSFNLGDEYAELRGPPTGSLDAFSNLQVETEAQRGAGAARVLHGDEIKWRWHRVDAIGVVSAALTLAAGVLTVKLRSFEALFFGVGDIVHLRQRIGRNALLKFPRLSGQMVVDSVDATNDLVRIRASGVVITYPNLVPIANAIATFGIGSVLYRPRPAPASVHHATDYPYAELVAHNIKSFITRNRVPLVAFPPVANVPTAVDSSEQIPVFVPDTDPAGVGLAPALAAADRVRIVGLYPGGARNHLGAFHPAGHCLMRGTKVPTREFCAVCRYILAETIDPALHDLVDREYDRIYPQA